MVGVAKVYRWELVKLAAQKRTYLGIGAAILVPIAFVVALVLQKGAGTERHPARPNRPRHRARDSVRRPLLPFDLGPSADHGARRRRHRRVGDAQRHAEDHPHALT